MATFQRLIFGQQKLILLSFCSSRSGVLLLETICNPGITFAQRKQQPRCTADERVKLHRWHAIRITSRSASTLLCNLQWRHRGHAVAHLSIKLTLSLTISSDVRAGSSLAPVFPTNQHVRPHVRTSSYC
jgi:hypothetical protein